VLVPNASLWSVVTAVEAGEKEQAGTKLALSGNQVDFLRNSLPENAVVALKAITGRSTRTKFPNLTLALFVFDRYLQCLTT
jgi:hypothetical protein